MTFSDAIKTRRTVYGLGKKVPVSDEKIQELIEDAVKYVPSAFNSKTSRVVVLKGAAHDELWDETLSILTGMVKDPEALKQTEARIAGFKAAYGTVLFFEDQDTITYLQTNYALYKDNFPVWSNQSSGMLQFAVWTSLAEHKVGANLQHYNPLVDNWVAKKTGAPASWKLLALMPYGSIEAAPGEKDFGSLEGRIKVIA